MHHTSRTGVCLNRSRAPRGGIPEDAVLTIHKVNCALSLKCLFYIKLVLHGCDLCFPYYWYYSAW